MNLEHNRWYVINLIVRIGAFFSHLTLEFHEIFHIYEQNDNKKCVLVFLLNFN